MAKSTNLYLPQNINNKSITLTNADTTVTKLAFTAGAEGSHVIAMIATSDDTVEVDLKFYIVRGGIEYLLDTLPVTPGSGTNASNPGIDLLNATAGTLLSGLPLSNVGKRYIPVGVGDTLKIGCLATMTAAKTCTVSVFGEDL